MSELKDGMVRGGGFDRDCESAICTRLGYCPQERIVKACQSLGAEIVSSNADICVVFGFLPQYPVMLKLWLADEELPGSGRMLVNGMATKIVLGSWTDSFCTPKRSYSRTRERNKL